MIIELIPFLGTGLILFGLDVFHFLPHTHWYYELYRKLIPVFPLYSQIQMEGFHKLQDDLEKVIEKDDSASSITTDSEETKPEFRTLRDKLKYVFDSNKFQITIVCFVIIDCLLVVSELLLDLEVFPKEASDSVAPHVLHYASIGILGLFLVEIMTRVVVFRLEFFKHKLEVFDAVVVIVSFVLDVIYRNKEGPESGIGLLIVLRLWRVTRILNGKFYNLLSLSS